MTLIRRRTQVRRGEQSGVVGGTDSSLPLGSLPQRRHGVVMVGRAAASLLLPHTPPQLAASSRLPPAGLRRDHLELAFDTAHSVEETTKRGQETATAVISLTRACVSIYCSLVPLESRSLMTLWNFLRALCLTSTPGSVALASCCGCPPSGLSVHPFVDLQRARPHSVCALWPSCLYTLADPMPWRLYLPSGCVYQLNTLPVLAICPEQWPSAAWRLSTSALEHTGKMQSTHPSSLALFSELP